VTELRTVQERAANLERALESNRRIGMAVGILMERHRVAEDAAFALLRAASNRTNTKLRDVAERVVYTGSLPG
jgi:AmiR/NasT family two-component response regulator